ncbi:hypothetical protein D3C78_1144840 [compost metagenome]
MDVGHGLAEGVVEVAGEAVARDAGADHVDQVAGSPGGAGADGVAQGHFVAAHGVELGGDGGHLLGGHLAVIGAAQYAGDIAPHADALGLGRFHHRHEARQALGDGAVDVLLRKGLGGGGEYRHFLHPGFQGGFEAFHVRRQGGVGDPGLALDLREDLGGTGHLRHPLGRHEAADFDIAEAGGGQVVHQAHLVGDADGLLLVLQAVARADFDQADLAGNVHCVISRFESLAEGR